MRLQISLVIVLTTLFSNGASAYVLLGQSWTNPVYTVNVRLQRAGTTPQQWNDAFQVAVDRWNAATNEFTINMNRDVFFDPCNNPSIGDPIGNGAIFMDTQCDDDFGSSTLASTLLWFNGNDQFVQAGIVFNGTRIWGVYDSNATPFQVDLTRVAVHELGHAMGLGHEDSVPAIMSTTVSNITHPQPDDIAGIAEIYGDPGADMSISQSLMDEISLHSQNGILEVSINNNGPNAVSSVVIDIEHDSFISFVSATSLFSGTEPEPDCGVISQESVQCTYSALEDGLSRTFEARFSFSDLGPFSITSTVSSNLEDLDATNNSQTSNGEVIFDVNDRDADGVANDQDNCPYVANPDQQDTDLDGVGDACITSDFDGDSLFDHLDNCPDIENAGQQDADADGVGNPCDQFNASLLNVNGLSSATFTNGEANSGSEFSVSVENLTELDAGTVSFAAYSEWPSDPSSTLLTENSDIGLLGPLSTNPLNTVSATHTLVTNRDAPIVLSVSFTDPESSSTSTVYIAFNSNGTVIQDSDGDEVPDANDQLPLNPNESLDSDGDGIGNNADLDDDNDGLSDADEVLAGTDPVDTDTDDDGMNDAFEVANGFDPLVADCPDEICDHPSSLLRRILPALDQ